jgi:uncharacterized membrane protein SpoIIM required for sporulation
MHLLHCIQVLASVRPKGNKISQLSTGNDEMNKICIFIGIAVFGWIGWWLGDRFGLMTAYLLGCVGSLVGVYVGWRINRDYLS